jgi:hypothetical protein
MILVTGATRTWKNTTQVSFYDMIGIVTKGLPTARHLREEVSILGKRATRPSYLYCRRQTVLISDTVQKSPLASPEVS